VPTMTSRRFATEMRALTGWTTRPILHLETNGRRQTEMRAESHRCSSTLRLFRESVPSSRLSSVAGS